MAELRQRNVRSCATAGGGGAAHQLLTWREYGARALSRPSYTTFRDFIKFTVNGRHPSEVSEADTSMAFFGLEREGALRRLFCGVVRARLRSHTHLCTRARARTHTHRL